MLTADTITDAQIWAFRDSLPRGDWRISVCADALGSAHHPQRRKNNRAMCARLITDAKDNQ